MPSTDEITNVGSKWDIRFLKLAQHISKWSKDPSTKVGAVIVDDDHRVISVGYNGFPKGVDDTPSLYSDRSIKYDLIVHAERNALLFAKQSLKGCTLYTFPFMACPACAGMVIQAGIVRHVAPVSYNERWVNAWAKATMMLYQAQIKLDLINNFISPMTDEGKGDSEQLDLFDRQPEKSGDSEIWKPASGRRL